MSYFDNSGALSLAYTIGSGANEMHLRTRWSNRQLGGGRSGWMMAQAMRLQVPDQAPSS